MFVNSFDFTGKVVIITGSSSGIGAQTAINLAKSGAQLVLSASNREMLSEVIKKCEDSSPNNLRVLDVLTNLTSEDKCKLLVEKTFETFGKIDVLITNADVIWNHTINDSEFIEKYKRVMKSNLNSVVFLVYFCIPYLIKTKGNIVINSSIASIVSSSCLTPICISKSALHTFTRIMARELAPKGIRVNAINPGAQITNNYKYNVLNKQHSDHSLQTYPFMRTLRRTPGQVYLTANAISYLASEQATFLNGFNYIDDCCCCQCFSYEIRGFYSINKLRVNKLD